MALEPFVREDADTGALKPFSRDGGIKPFVRHENPLAGAGRALGQGVRNVQDAMAWIGGNPVARGGMAALGTTERLGSGAITGAMRHGAKGAVVGSAKAAIDPEGETDRLHAIEKSGDDLIGRFIDATDKVLPGGGDWRHNPTVHEDATATGLKQAFNDVLVGSAIDPATYVPGLDLFTVGGRIARAARLGQGAAKFAKAAGKVAAKVPAAVRDPVKELAHSAHTSLTTSAIPRQGLTQHGLNELRAVEGGGHHLRHTLNQQFSAAHAPHADTLSQMSIVPPEMRRAMLPQDVDQQLDRIAYLGGDRETQTAALRNALSKPNGYRPSPEDRELAKNPLNIYTHYDPHYVPTQDVREDVDIDGRPTIIRKSKGTSTSHNKAANKAVTGQDFATQVRQRLEGAASEISRAHTQRTALERLGLNPAPDFQHIDDVIAHATKAGDQATVKRYTALKLAHDQKYQEQLARRAQMLEPNAAMEARNVNSEYSGPGGSLEDVQARARNQLSKLGVDTSAAFDKAGKVGPKTALGPLSNRVNANLASAALATRVASRARHAAQDVGAAASQASLKRQQAVEKAADAVQGTINAGRDSRAQRMQQLEQLVQDRAARATGGKVQRDVGNGPGFNLPGEAAITEPATQGTRASLNISKPVFNETDRAIAEAGAAGDDLARVRNAAVGGSTRGITAPANRAAAVADSAQRIQLRRLASAAKTAQTARQRNDALKALNARVQAIREREGTVNMPKVLAQRLYGETAKPADNFLGKLGGGLATALFTNPLPHSLGNIAQQQVFAGGGLDALLEGAGNALHQTPDAEKAIEEAKQVGATSTHGFHADEEPAALHQKLYNNLQKGMTRWHDAQAAELFKREKAKGLSEADAAEEVRKTFGRPYERAEVSDALSHVGAKLANFALATVPRSAKKALGSQQGRAALKNFSRANQAINEDYFEPTYGLEFNPGGFASRAASLALRPTSYFASRSLDTSLGSELGESKFGAGDVVKSALPFGEVLDAFREPLSDEQRARYGYEKLPAWLKLLGVTGAYFTHAETPAHKIRRELEREGLK